MKRKLLTELDREMILAQIKRLEIKDHYTIEWTKRIIKRTISQHHLYFLWVTCIAFETGNDKDYLHEFFKAKYLIPEIVNMFGINIEVRSTTNLNTIQFKYLLDHVQEFANTELQITLPNPEDQRWEEFYSFYKDKL